MNHMHVSHNCRFAGLSALRRWLDAARRKRCWQDWRWQLRAALDGAGMARFGLLPAETARRAVRRQAARVTPYYLDLSDLTDPADPLLRQWLPSAAEICSGGAGDPFDEAHHMPVPGVVQRFSDRILVLASAGCATACRHCTRRNTLGRRTPVVASAAQVRRVVAYVRARPEIREVILSGGDPLLLPDAALLRLVRAFAALPQLDAIRIGTRVPVVLPMRVTPELARQLGACRRVWVNTQFNHVREITPESAAACARLVEAGIPVSNQTVLLRGVNDSVEAMVALCAGLQRIRVRPYYAFVCDSVAGTAHLRIGRARARAIAAGVARRLGGLAMPRFVVDRPGAPCKLPV